MGISPMKLFFQMKITTLVTIFTSFAVTDTAKSDLVFPPPLWQRPISHVYVCSDTERVSSKSLENFYTDVTQISVQFHDGWNEPKDEKTHYDNDVIVAISSKELRPEFLDCLKSIPSFRAQWLESMAKQSDEIGTVPEYLANTPLGEYYEPLTASWSYSYVDGAVLSSYLYQDIEHFSYEDAVHGALQFRESFKTNTKNIEGD